jgi:hypothetical protein
MYYLCIVVLNNRKEKITMQNKLHYNCLGCPQCSNPLHDSLFAYERTSDIKTVACSNSSCDFTGKRKGWELLNKIEFNKLIIQKNESTLSTRVG